MVAAVTEAAYAEAAGRDRRPMRVWVFADERADDLGRRRKHRQAGDIAGLVIGDAERGREYAERRLAEVRGTGVPA